MPKDTSYFRTEWYRRMHITSTLTKASPLPCTMVWPGEPSKKMAWQDFMEFPLQKGLHFGDAGKNNNMLPFDLVHNPFWELHTSATTPPLLFSDASTTNFVGHKMLTSFVDRHKNINF